MKNIGLTALVVGVALSAAYGSRLSPSMRVEAIVTGRATLLEAQADHAFEAYCAALAGSEFALEEGCPADPDAEPVEGPAPRGSYEEQVAAGRARLDRLRAGGADLPAPVSALRRAWLEAQEASIEPSARAATRAPPPPEQRLDEWFADSGVPFLLGLALVVAGAVMARVAARRAAVAQGDGGGLDGNGSGAADFGRTLEGLRVEVRKLADGMQGVDDGPPEDFERIKEAIHQLQLDRLELLIEARPRVQAKFGTGPFAEIFGPLSSGERHMNRAWSALVDRHWPEARRSLSRAADDLAESHEILSSLGA